MEFIVGTILAVVPIVVEAYDRYWDLSNGLSTFRQYSQELKKLDTILDTQKTLFRGNVIKLLTAVTNNPEKARGLLSGKAAWDQLTFAPVYHNRVESLHETFTSWKATLEQVHAALKSICLEVEGFRTSSCTGTGKVRAGYFCYQGSLTKHPSRLRRASYSSNCRSGLNSAGRRLRFRTLSTNCEISPGISTNSQEGSSVILRRSILATNHPMKPRREEKQASPAAWGSTGRFELLHIAYTTLSPSDCHASDIRNTKQAYHFEMTWARRRTHRESSSWWL